MERFVAGGVLEELAWRQREHERSLRFGSSESLGPVQGLGLSHVRGSSLGLSKCTYAVGLWRSHAMTEGRLFSAPRSFAHRCHEAVHPPPPALRRRASASRRWSSAVATRTTTSRRFSDMRFDSPFFSARFRRRSGPIRFPRCAISSSFPKGSNSVADRATSGDTDPSEISRLRGAFGPPVVVGKRRVKTLPGPPIGGPFQSVTGAAFPSTLSLRSGSAYGLDRSAVAAKRPLGRSGPPKTT
jgi:hypothetical protein